jgi:hypothetical protein
MNDKVKSFITSTVNAAVSAAELDNPNSAKREGSVNLTVTDSVTNKTVTVIVEAHGIVDGKPRRHFHADQSVAAKEPTESSDTVEKFQSIKMTGQELADEVSAFLHQQFAESERVNITLTPANTPNSAQAGNSDDGKLEPQAA